MPHIVNANELEWLEEPRFPGIALQLLVSKTVTPTVSLIQARVKPDHEISTHVHEHETEIVYISQGTAVIKMSDTEYTLTSGGCVVIPPGTLHSLHNNGDELVELIAIHSPPTR